MYPSHLQCTHWELSSRGQTKERPLTGLLQTEQAQPQFILTFSRIFYNNYNIKMPQLTTNTIKCKKLLKWKPLVGLENGVEILLNNLDYWKAAPIWDQKSIAKATEKWFEYLS